MMTRGSWVRVVKFVGVTGLVCSLLVVTALRSAGKRSPQAGAGLSAVAASPASKISATKGDPKWGAAYGKLPLSFEENQGQSASEVRYLSHGSGYELFLTPQEAVLALQPNVPHDLSPLHRTAALRALRKVRRTGEVTAIRMRLEGANPDARIAGMDKLPGRTNYFIGNDPSKWHTDVPSYAQVRYSGIYPGVDLVFYGNQRRLEYDFVVAPGADPKAIAMKVDGARKMHINSRGDLVLNVAGGEVELQKPVVYQNVKGERREIAATYTLTGNNRAAFNVGSYDRSEPLILDPVLNYSTYLGGSAGDVGFAIAVDASGNAFIAGETFSTNFPPGTKVYSSTSPSPNNGASFVAELNPAGTQLLYSTYLAGTQSNPFESANGIAVDSGGKVYVTGGTFASDFPMPTTPNGFKSGSNIGALVNGTSYIAKLDPAVSGAGSLLYSSYIGGTNGIGLFGGDFGQAIAVDANGIAYVAGYTDSTPSTTVTSMPNFPIVNGFQTTLNSTNGNAFLAKIDTTKSGSASLIYSTYVGGAGAHAAPPPAQLQFGEEAFGVAIDANGNAYLAGTTSSTDFPTSGNAYQRNLPPGNTTGTAFVTQIDTTKIGAPSKIYSTYLGGATLDQAYAIALGPGNVAYVSGNTTSIDFPVTPRPGAFDTNGAASGKAFVSLIDTTVPSLKYSTFLGGTGSDTGFGIRADAQGNAYVAGTTSSVDFPFPPKASIVGGFQPKYPVNTPSVRSVGFISKLNPGGNGTADLLYSTYFGGIGNINNGDHIFAIAIDASNPANAYVTGQTYSTAATFPVFPTTAPTAFQPGLNGTSDAFVAKLTPIPTLAVAPTSLNFGTIVIPNSAAKTVRLTNNTNAAIAFTSAVVNGSPTAANTDYTVTNSCSGSIPFGATNTCDVTVTFKPTVVGSETATLRLTDSDSTSPQDIALTGTAPAPDFDLKGPTTTQNVTAGSTLNFNVTMTPLNGFTGTVALTCAGAPNLSTCTVTPTSVAAANGTTAQTAQVSLTTTALMAPPTRIPTTPVSMRQVVPVLLAMLLMFFLARTQLLRMRLGMVAAMVLLLALAGCGGGKSPGTTKGPATLTITGTSGTLAQKTVQVPISVN
jgi:hypothetical protein